MNPIVVVIDSGVRKEVIGDNLLYEINLSHKSSSVKDSFGHGTACAMVIKSILNSVKIISISILDEFGFTNTQILEKALTYCLNINCHIINLSLAILDHKSGNIESICNKLKEQSKIIVSSIKNNCISSEPAIYNSVIGVRGVFLSDIHKYWFNKNYKVQLITDISPVFTSKHLNKSFIFSGNSKAAAVGTGIIAKIINTKNKIDIDEVLNDLSRNSERNKWTEGCIEKKLEMEIKDNLEEVNAEIILQMFQILKKVCGEFEIEVNDDLKMNDNLFEKGIISTEMIIPFFDKLSESFNVNLNIDNVSPYSLVSLKSLYKECMH